MEITVNGKPVRLDDGMPLEAFLAERGLAGGSVVERNGEIIARDKRRLVTLRDGDVLEVVRLVGGG